MTLPSKGIPRWSTAGTPRASVRFTPDTFRELNRFINDAEGNARKTKSLIDLLVRYIAGLCRAYAQKHSMGPVAPGRTSNPALAFKIPVQRITGRYFAGWKMKRIGLAHYIVYNSSREAFFIEEGIFPGRPRIPRRILKHSVVQTVRMLHSTRVVDRFAAGAYGARQNQRGQFQSFASSITVGPSAKLPG